MCTFNGSDMKKHRDRKTGNKRDMQRTYAQPSGGFHAKIKQPLSVSISFLINDDDGVSEKEAFAKKKMVLPTDPHASKDSWRITLPPLNFPDYVATGTLSPSSVVLAGPVDLGEQVEPALPERKPAASSILPSEMHSNYQTPERRRSLITNLLQRHNYSSSVHHESPVDLNIFASSPPNRSSPPHISISTRNYLSKLLQRKPGNGDTMVSREEMARRSKRYKNRISVQKCRRKSRERQMRLEFERKTLRRENAFLQQLKVLVEKSGALNLVPKDVSDGREGKSSSPKAVPITIPKNSSDEGNGMLIPCLSPLI